MSLAIVLPFLGTLIDKVFPDPAKADAAKLEVMKMAQAGELAQLNADLELAKGQMDVNKAEAANSSVFVSGWRPAVGWCCVAGCGWNWVGLPAALFIMSAIGHPVAVKPADLTEMLPILVGMLGLGAMRTREKEKGVA